MPHYSCRSFSVRFDQVDYGECVRGIKSTNRFERTYQYSNVNFYRDSLHFDSALTFSNKQMFQIF